ncbi:hypothetical protein QE152_g39234 [Popillia japonica]|uniref:Uncharacterized protein n=1 Tax=Popillia japonica TaxID=7064 RepID=A0AAW1HUK3_POPJA
MDYKAGPSGGAKRRRHPPSYYKELTKDEQLEAFLYSDGSSDLYKPTESESNYSSGEDGEASDINAQSFTVTPVNAQNPKNVEQCTANNSVIWGDVPTEMKQFPVLGKRELLLPVPPDAKPIIF